jgi:hypothetical protein
MMMLAHSMEIASYSTRPDFSRKWPVPSNYFMQSGLLACSRGERGSRLYGWKSAPKWGVDARNW